MRGLAYKRREREKHIKRKEKIIRGYRLDNPPHRYDDENMWAYLPKMPISLSAFYTSGEGAWLPYYYVPSRGYLSKGKIYCSCSLCSTKTRKKNYSINDLRKIQHLEDALKEYIYYNNLY